MAEETAPREAGPKKRLTKGQAIGVMVAGGVLMVLPMIIPTEQGSTAHTLKVIVGFVGFCVLCAGAYLRP
ncbi:MAG TPA: hypothetical protein VLM91_06985 [Candidatus Methylomirabilis sp.]|nr:hypothetical protein [Candidatus Methylomirabilis sp.]